MLLVDWYGWTLRLVGWATSGAVICGDLVCLEISSWHNRNNARYGFVHILNQHCAATAVVLTSTDVHGGRERG